MIKHERASQESAYGASLTGYVNTTFEEIGKFVPGSYRA